MAFLLTRFCHANTTVNDCESVVCLVRYNVDKEFRLSIKLALVSQALKTDLVQCLNIIQKRKDANIRT